MYKYESFIESSKKTWILLEHEPLAERCLDLMSPAHDWCYVIDFPRPFRLLDSKCYIAIDPRFVKEAEEALRKCLETGLAYSFVEKPDEAKKLEYFLQNLREASLKKTTWVVLRVKPMVYFCLDLMSPAHDWFFGIGPFDWGYVRGHSLWDYIYIAIDPRFVKEAEEALRKCVALMKRDVALAEALAGGNKPEHYEDVMKELRRFLQALRKATPYEKSIDKLISRIYVLAELTLPEELEKDLKRELERINREIGVVLYLKQHVTFKYRGKELAIGEVHLSELPESAEFVATEEEAVRDILTAVRRVLPDHADKIEEAIEKLRLFKKLLDQTAE